MKEKEYLKYIQQNSWFHGTTLKNWKRLCKSGVLCEYNRGLESDFGYGFYLAPKEKQARNYIERILPYMPIADEDKIPVVIEFSLNIETLLKQGYKHKVFRSFDEEFAEFVAMCRLHPEEKMHNYDFVIGVMTDSNPLKLISDYRSGTISEEELHQGLMKWNSMEQISLHNQEICDTLRVVRVYNVNEEKEENANEYNKRFVL